MSTSEPLDLFARAARQASWRFNLTDQGGNPIGNLEVDRDSPPTVSVDTGRSAKRTLQRVNLPPGEFSNVDIVRDRLSLEMLLDDGSTWPMGLYLFTGTSQEALSSPLFGAVHLAHLDLVDQTLIVDQPTDRSYTARPFTVLTNFIQTVLAGLPITVNVQPSGNRVGAEAISWPAGTNRLRIVNEVARMLGYHELYFDNAGVGQLGPMPDPLTVDAEDTINYSSTPRVYRPSFTRSDDLLDLPNRFIVIGSGAAENPAVGRYTLPSSVPHSVSNRGFVVAHSEQLQGIETGVQAFWAAVALSREYRFAHETVDFTGPPDPRHDHFDTLEVEGVRLLEVAWSMSLREGAPMRHTARRTYTTEGEG